ncbi:hypothetical protein F9C11_27490 [Amycolatopsis sp. VS8301801F10]|uniref:hypothetical protein n=1 Tax=Amycolatopsis sp. VS8301801F10 TaxID=2652442 RepID=UPI0038FD38A0
MLEIFVETGSRFQACDPANRPARYRNPCATAAALEVFAGNQLQAPGRATVAAIWLTCAAMFSGTSTRLGGVLQVEHPLR